ncbi:MAG: nucleotidyltransferase [Sedimentisphaerales bacterium]|nr:nucleotidyltransferase [Sedimentisphaerales bacterium]
MDVEKLLKLLKENKVRFVIIGATAFPVYGYSRTTLDIDIFIEPKSQNAERTRKALAKFGYDVADVSVEDLLTKKVLIRQYLVETDIHPFVTGADFESVWSHKVKGKFGDTFVWFASLDDLIKMKKAAGRAKDLEDLKYLLKLKRKMLMAPQRIRQKRPKN